MLLWAEQYIHQARPFTHLKFNLDYFNTASALWLAKIINVLGRIDEPDYVLMVHLFLPVEEFDNIEGFDDIRDIFIPVADIYHGASNSLCIKLYGTNEKGETVKETFVFFEAEQLVNSELV